MRWKCSALFFFFNLPQERFIGQRWSLWPSFVLLGSLWTPSQAAEGEEASQAPILSGTSFSASSSRSTPAVGSLTGPNFSLRSALAGLGSNCSQTGAWGCGSRGYQAPQGATSTRELLRGAGRASGCCSLSSSAIWGGCGQDPGRGKRQGGSGDGGLPGPSREGQAGPSRGLHTSRGAGGPRAWGQGGCLFLVRVL